MAVYEILNVGVNTTLEGNTSSDLPPSINDTVAVVQYLKDGQEYSINLPEPSIKNFVLIEDVTEELIIEWVKKYENT